VEDKKEAEEHVTAKPRKRTGSIIQVIPFAKHNKG